MALTKEEWLQKCKNLVQSWVAEGKKSEAVFKGISAVLDQVEHDYTEHLAQTYIDQAEMDYVKEHGEERSVAILPDESIISYRVRVKRVTAQSNWVELKYVVDGFLITGESRFVEHSQDSGSFLSVGMCLDRDLLDFSVLYNAFTIIVDKQTGPDSDLIFENIVRAMNKNKASGVVYRIIERVT
jgi:hypothetical protein